METGTEQYLDIKTAADLLGVTEHEVRRRCREGTLKATKIDVAGAPGPAQWRIDPESVNQAKQGIVGKPEGAAQYWVGVFEGSPRQNWTLGGIQFPMWTEDVRDPGNGSLVTERITRRGDLVWLDAAAVERIKDAAIWLKVRTVGKVRVVVSGRNSRYRRWDTDLPAGRFVFMLQKDEAAKRYGSEWRESDPEPLIS